MKRHKTNQEIAEAQVATVLDLYSRSLVNKRTGTVYFIKCNGIYKIGRTKNLKNRLANLQIANGHKITVIATALVHDSHALEQWLHITMRHHKIKGEWFKLPRLSAWAVKKILHEVV